MCACVVHAAIAIWFHGVVGVVPLCGGGLVASIEYTCTGTSFEYRYPVWHGIMEWAIANTGYRYRGTVHEKFLFI